MIHWNKFVVSSILLVMLSTLGCIKKRVDTSGFQPFEDKSYDNVLCLVIDLSGSFVDDWQNDSKAHQMFVSVMDDFFNDSMGEESRIVVSQISAQVPYVIFDGTPKDFVQQFPNPEELNRFLIENSNPDRSEVYLSIDKTLSYINQIDGIGTIEAAGGEGFGLDIGNGLAGGGGGGRVFIETAPTQFTMSFAQVSIEGGRGREDGTRGTAIINGDGLIDTDNDGVTDPFDVCPTNGYFGFVDAHGRPLGDVDDDCDVDLSDLASLLATFGL